MIQTKRCIREDQSVVSGYDHVNSVEYGFSELAIKIIMNFKWIVANQRLQPMRPWYLLVFFLKSSCCKDGCQVKCSFCDPYHTELSFRVSSGWRRMFQNKIPTFLKSKFQTSFRWGVMGPLGWNVLFVKHVTSSETWFMLSRCVEGLWSGV